jgi:hypothetical protein
MPDSAPQLIWKGNTICVGLKTEYSMLKIDNDKENLDNVVSVLSIDRKDDPFMILMDDEVLLRLGNYGVFCYINGIIFYKP